MQPPPAFDSRSVDFQNRFADGQRAVVPHEEEHEGELESAIIYEKIETRHEETDAVEDEFELLVVVLVANLLRSIQDRHVDVSEDNLKAHL